MFVSFPTSCNHKFLKTSTIQVLTKEEGGRYGPFGYRYKPQVFIRTADVTTNLEWPEGTDDPTNKMVCWPTLVHSSNVLN